MSTTTTRPRVGIVGGSRSDLPLLEKARALLDELGIANELRVMSAHRTPALVDDWTTSAAERGIEVIIAGAGMAAALPYVDEFVEGHSLGSLEELVRVLEEVTT